MSVVLMSGLVPILLFLVLNIMPAFMELSCHCDDLISIAGAAAISVLGITKVLTKEDRIGSAAAADAGGEVS